MLAGKHSREEATMSSTDERLAERRKKWADDTHIINSAIKEIEAKATELQVRISVEHGPGRPGWVTIGSASFAGNSPSKFNQQMVWNVHEDGTITTFHGKGASQVQRGRFDLDKANKETYEKHILDFVETLV
jgi:hypothetical protein